MLKKVKEKGNEEETLKNVSIYLTQRQGLQDKLRKVERRI